MTKYIHIHTSSTDTRDGWIASYATEELDERGITAEQAFDEDEGVTLIDQAEAVMIKWQNITLVDSDGEQYTADRNSAQFFSALDEYRKDGSMTDYNFEGFDYNYTPSPDMLRPIDWTGYDARV